MVCLGKVAVGPERLEHVAYQSVPGVEGDHPGGVADVIVGVGREELVGKEEDAVGGDPFGVGVSEAEEDAAFRCGKRTSNLVLVVCFKWRRYEMQYLGQN